MAIVEGTGGLSYTRSFGCPLQVELNQLESSESSTPGILSNAINVNEKIKKTVIYASLKKEGFKVQIIAQDSEY